MTQLINSNAKLTAFRVCCFIIALLLFLITFTFTPWNATWIPIIGRSISMHALRVYYRLCQEVRQSYLNPRYTCSLLSSVSCYNGPLHVENTIGFWLNSEWPVIYCIIVSDWLLCKYGSADDILNSELQWCVIPSLYQFVHFNVNFVHTRASLMAI